MQFRFNLSKTAQRLETLSSRKFVIGSITVIILIGIVDHLTGPITSLTIFYLLPVAATAWIVGTAAGNGLAFFAALTWAVADRFGPYSAPKALLAYWDDLSIVFVFVAINIALGALHRQTKRDRQALQDVQRHLLPATIPVLPNAELAWRWEPAWTVAGDYYDVIATGAGSAICVADVSGKGMPAALIMSNVQATVRLLTAQEMPPARILTLMNEAIHGRVRPGSFVTMFYGTFDTNSGDLVYVNAGHPPPILRSAEGVVSQLTPTGPVAGAIARAHFAEAQVRLHPGDVLVVYSDGVTEYENAAGEQFGDARLRETVAGSAGLSADDICRTVFARLEQFGGAVPFNDDVTLVVLRRLDRLAG